MTIGSKRNRKQINLLRYCSVGKTKQEGSQGRAVNIFGAHRTFLLKQKTKPKPKICR